jgi:hypothetical protein
VIGLRSADLVGTWRLRAWRAETEDGSVVRPFGEHPLGYVVYTPDGHMITTISMAKREPIGGDIMVAPTEAQAAAFGSFMAYSGSFEVDGADIVHRVEMSLYPDWVGTEQRRHAVLDERGAILTLSTDPISVAGVTMRHRLEWERVSR